MAKHDIPIDFAFQIGLCVSLVLYGFYFAVFILTLYTRSKCQTQSWILTGAIIVLFLMCSIIVALNTVICYLMLEQTGILPTTLFLRNPFVPRDDWYPVRDVLLWFSGIIADILLVWRLYMVWYQKRRVLIIPCVILAIVICASVITTISECLIFIYPAHKARRLLLLHNCASPVAWIATLVNNLVCTTLIVWRLWRIARTAEGRATTRLANPAVAAFIESGGLYTGTILCMMLLIVTQMEGATYVVVPILPVVIGIAPTSIILRLNLTAHKKGSASIQNDMAFATPSATTLRLHDPKLAQLSTVEAGLDTGPEATFAKRSDFATTTCRKVPVDVTFVSSTMSSQH